MQDGSGNPVEYPEGVKGDPFMEAAFRAAGAPKGEADDGVDGVPGGTSTGGVEPDGAAGGTGGADGGQGFNWNELGEEFKSKDDVVKVIDDYKKIKSAPVPGLVDIDPTFYRLSKLKKENPEEYDFYKKIVLDGNVDPIEVLAIDYIRANPKFKGQEEKVRNYIRGKYGLDEEIPEEPDAEDTSDEANSIRRTIAKAKERRDFSQLSLESDADRALKSFNETFEKIEAPVLPDSEQVQKMRDQNKAAFESVGAEVMKSVNTLPVNILNKDKQGVKLMDFTLNDAHKKRLSELIVEYGSMVQGQITQDVLTGVISSAISRFKLEYADEFNSVIMSTARAMAEADYHSLYHNPSPVGGGAGQESAPGAVNPAQKSRSEALRLEGIN